MKDFRLATGRIPLIYAIFGLLWILFTDRLLFMLVPDIDVIARIQTYKGWLFVILSTVIISGLVARSAQQNRAAQEALAQSEELYRLLFNNNPLPMWVFDLSTLKFLEVNDAAVDKYQYSREEFLNLTLKDVRPPEDVPLLLNDLAQMAKPINYAGEWWHRRQDGTVFPVEVISHEMNYNGRTTHLAVAKDLTEQKRVEAERASVFQRNQALVQALGEIVYEWFPERGEVMWEGDYGRILGYLADEMGSTTDEWYEKIHPGDQDRVRQAVDKAIIEERQNLEIEYRFLQHGGTYRWMLDRGVPNLNEQGELEKVVGVLLDINGRKQTEDALRQSEVRFRKAIEFAPFPIAIHAEDGDMLSISQAWLNITGYAFEEISTIDKWAKRAYGKDRANILASIDKLYELDQRSDEGEFAIICKDGSQRTWEFSSTPLGRLPDGRRSVISIAVDATERKNAEKQMHLQSTALDAAANGIVITDIHGKVEWANPAFTELTGYTLAEALGKNPRELVKSGVHDSAFYEPLWHTILDGNIWRGELINRRKDGTHYYEEEAITPVWNEDGVMTHFIAIKQDITKRKQAEEEREQLLEQVQSQAEQMNQIMQSVPEGIFMLDQNGEILIANDKAKEYLAYLAGVAVGDTLIALGERSLASLLMQPEHGNWHEIRFQDHIFELIPQQVKSGPVAQGWVLVLREVTEQKRIEEQLHRQERLAAIGQLAAGIAHDFNNLMAVILLYAQLLSRSSRLNAKEQAQLSTINQQAKRAARLIEQILDFSRRAVFERRPLDLLSLLKEEVKLLQRTLPESIEIKLDCAPENYIVQADVTRIQQTIMNLAFNARDAMPEGGRLQFKLSPLTFEHTDQAPLPMMQPGSWIHLSVTDTGTGIEPTVLDRIFEPFVTTKEPGKGTGLGLSQVHGIVAQHGGFITVQSQPGIGSTFDVYLPAMTLQADTAVVERLETAVSGQGERLLVVEDEPDLRNALVESLTLLQYDVRETANGTEALALLEQGTAVDLIICDVIMPKMGGIPFVQALQRQKSPPPVIFVTGHPLDINSDSLREMGVCNVLPKPIQPVQLSQAIAAALKQ